jgi:hypothetical protein
MPERRKASVLDFRQNLRDMRMPRGTGDMADYERGKRLIETWLRDMSDARIVAPPYEQLVQLVADWVGV